MAVALLETWGEPDLRRLHALYRHAWWARGRALDETRRLVRGSSVALGLVDGDELVAFSRAISDGACKALVLDVIVRPDRRASGLGARVLEHLLAHPAVRDAASVELYCLDELRPFYERLGFSADVGGVSLMRLSRRPG